MHQLFFLICLTHLLQFIIIEESNPDYFHKIVEDLERGVWKYSNFQHLIVYGSLNSNKENLVNIILEKQVIHNFV
jgi:hypothetical protein